VVMTLFPLVIMCDGCGKHVSWVRQACVMGAASMCHGRCSHASWVLVQGLRRSTCGRQDTDAVQGGGVHAKAWPERAERGSAMCSSFDCPGTTLDTPFRCGADGAGHHQSEDNAMFEGDGMLPVPVYRSYKKMPPVTLRSCVMLCNLISNLVCAILYAHASARCTWRLSDKLQVVSLRPSALGVFESYTCTCLRARLAHVYKTGLLRHSVTLALIRMLKIGRLQMRMRRWLIPEKLVRFDMGVCLTCATATVGGCNR